MPVNPAAHEHVNEAVPSLHVAPFVHSDDAHSLMFVAHDVLVNPAAQVHANEAVPSLHVAPLPHGVELHSPTAVSQSVPV